MELHHSPAHNVAIIYRNVLSSLKLLGRFLNVSNLGRALAGVTQASAQYDYFCGTFICDYVKTTPQKGDDVGFKIGDQIFGGVTELDLSWISPLGTGLHYDCERTGDSIICPIAKPEDYPGGPPKKIDNSVFDVNTKKFYSRCRYLQGRVAVQAGQPSQGGKAFNSFSAAIGLLKSGQKFGGSNA